uniref:Btz domain-containing protein n=1 Tax=Gongylonema pulchrum TaxID=637853 RepID=A0A183CYN3_9BILA
LHDKTVNDLKCEEAKCGPVNPEKKRGEEWRDPAPKGMEERRNPIQKRREGWWSPTQKRADERPMKYPHTFYNANGAGQRVTDNGNDNGASNNLELMNRKMRDSTISSAAAASSGELSEPAPRWRNFRESTNKFRETSGHVSQKTTESKFEQVYENSAKSGLQHASGCSALDRPQLISRDVNDAAKENGGKQSFSQRAFVSFKTRDAVSERGNFSTFPGRENRRTEYFDERDHFRRNDNNRHQGFPRRNDPRYGRMSFFNRNRETASQNRFRDQNGVEPVNQSAARSFGKFLAGTRMIPEKRTSSNIGGRTYRNENFGQKSADRPRRGALPPLSEIDQEHNHSPDRRREHNHSPGKRRRRYDDSDIRRMS